MASNLAHGSRAYRLTVSGLIVVMTLVVFANSWGVFTADIKPEVYLAPQTMVGDYLSAWTFSPYLGGPNFNAGLAPVVGFLAVLRGLGMSPEIAFKVFHLLLWLAAAGGMSQLARRLDPTLGRLSLVAGVVYIANPYAVSAGATLAILLPMAVLPWQLLVLLRALERPASWRWPALFGVTFFLMSGMNAGVVPVLGLLAVIPVTVYAKHRYELRWRAVVAVIAKCALFVLWVSLYWLVPSIAAATTGASVVENSETMASISDVSSFAEALRGLGLWPLYGAGSSGPWQPGHVAYLTNPVVVVATFLVPALALLSLAVVRAHVARLLMSLVVLAVVVMVGMHPTGSPSPFGSFLGRLFAGVPAMSAFRTTNKIGAVLVVGVAIACAFGVREVMRRLRTGPQHALFLAVCGVVIVTVSLPAWTGKLYISEVDIPGYWKQTAAAVNDAPSERRVLALPGQVQAAYRWSQPRPDDVFNSLFERDVMIPITTPSTSATAFNFGAALDDTFQSGLADEAATSTFARYLGADSIILRHDVNWEEAGGARPSQTQQTVNADPGLTPVRNFGEPGENVGSPTVAADGFSEVAVPPVQLYGVDNARSMVRAEPQQGSLVVAGDGWSVAAMARRGILGGSPAFRYAHDLPATELGAALGSVSRMVLTDTNRRRDSIPNRLTNGQGPLLAASEALPATARTLGASSDDQTVLQVEGGRATASARGYAFFDLPWAAAENAFDNDPQTAWIFGDFKSGAGQTLQLELDEPRRLGRMQIQQPNLGPVRISSILVSAGGRTQRATFGADGMATADLDVSASDVTFTIGELVGDGFNAVGVADVQIEGVGLLRVARTPKTLDKTYDALSAAEREDFDATPLDVLLTRAQGTAAMEDDEEVNLERNFSLPDDRRFTARSIVRLDADREDLFDRVAGVPTAATSSSRIFDNPDVRASMAFDGDRGTGWIPGRDVAGSWIKIDGPARQLSTLTFEQRKLPDATRTDWATSVSVVADGRTIASARVQPGTNSIDLTTGGVAPAVRSVRVEIDTSAAPGQGSPPRIVEIGAGRTLTPRSGASPCLTVATLDGDPVQMRHVGGDVRGAAQWRACGGAFKLASGDHQLRSSDPGITIDSFDLRDVRKTLVQSGDPVPDVDVDRGFGASMTLRASPNPSAKPYFLTIGQAYDSRWQAFADGKDLGRPIVVDGYATGWLVDSASAMTIDITYGPQRPTDLAIVASVMGLVLAMLIVLSAYASARIRSVGRWQARWAARRNRAAARLRGISPRLRPRPAGVLSSHVGVHARRTLRWVAVLTVAWVFASWPGLVAVALLMGWFALRVPSRRRLIAAGAGLVLLAGPIFWVGMGEYRGTVSSALVTESPWPNLATVCGLVFVIVGVWRSEADEAVSEMRSHRV